MEKKVFKALTRRFFENNDFICDNKKIFKEINDFILFVELDKTTYGGEFYYVYLKVFFKTFYEKDEIMKSNICDFQIRIQDGNLPLKLHYNKLSEEDYINILDKVYANDIKKFIINGSKFIFEHDRFKFSPHARKFFNL